MTVNYQERVDSHHTVLFGEDGLHGIAGQDGSINKVEDKVKDTAACLGKKISTTKFYGTLGSIAVSLLILVFTLGTCIMQDEKMQDDKISNVCMEQRLLKQELGHIQSGVADIKKQQISKAEMLIVMKRAIEESK